MGKVRRPSLGRVVTGILAVLAAAPLLCQSVPSADANSLFARTASEKLTRNFSSSDISYLLYDITSERFIATKWRDSNKPIPVGSLVKPFVALAYAETHDYRYPDHHCDGGTSCWLPKGHGKLGIVRAMALSCNSYFTALASNVGGVQVTPVASRLRLHGPGPNASAEALAGKFGVWRESPEDLVRAYATLLGRRSQPGIREVLAGMAASVKDGTASGISRQKLRQTFVGKTGTAPCTHKEHAPGDGFVITAWPADAPRYILLVRQHSTPGAQVSVLAGRMLRELEP